MSEAQTPIAGVPNQWMIAPELAGKTVAAVVKAFVPNLSWRRIKQSIQQRYLSVNGGLCVDETRRVQAGDLVEFHARPLALPPSDMSIRLRHLDDAIVVVEKPSGMVTLRHVAQLNWSAERRRMEPTLDEVVLRLIGKSLSSPVDLSAEPARMRRKYVRAVHRIDRDTSGLVVFARTLAAEQHLIRQFSEHSIQRVYQAVVTGRPASQTVTSRLVRDRGDGLRGSTVDPGAGKLAITHIRLLEPLGDFSLVECRLETGRTHQIRIQMAELCYPVCGDLTYRGPLARPPIADVSGAPRLALHAEQLDFVHPTTKERLRFEAAVPGDLANFIARLRLESCGRPT